MGTPHPPNEPGNLCVTCWGPGKDFGPGPTPHVIAAALTRLLPGEFWNPDHEQLLLTTHYLEQTAAPCVWEIDDHVFRWTLNYNLQFTSFEVRRNSDNRLVFVDARPPPCLTDVASDLDVPDANVAWNGFANFYWNVEDLDS